MITESEEVIASACRRSGVESADEAAPAIDQHIPVLDGLRIPPHSSCKLVQYHLDAKEKLFPSYTNDIERAIWGGRV
jgi:hypothetical protein